MTPTKAPLDTSPPSGSSWSRLRPLIFGAGAAALWGGWAFHANLGSGVAAALRAALTQAALSFAATGGMSLILERLFRLGRTPAEAFWLAALGSAAIAVTVTVSIHALAGTPNILLTVAPSNALGMVFGFAYAWGLRAGTKRAR